MGKPGRMPQQIAVVFALCAFSVALACGVMFSVTSTTALVRALVVLTVAYPIGRVFGAVVTVALNEHLTAAFASNPVPDAVRLASNGDGEIGEVDVIDDVENA